MKTSTLVPAAALAIVATLAVGTSASAHMALVSVTPGEGETVASVNVIDLEFNEALLELGVVVTVTDPSGANVATGEPDLSVPRHVLQPVDAQIAGLYTVDWRVVADDGHPVEGKLTFEFAPSASSPVATDASESATPTATAPASPSPSVTEASAPTPDATDADSPSTADPSTALLVALAGAVTAAILFALRYAARLRRGGID